MIWTILIGNTFIFLRKKTWLHQQYADSSVLFGFTFVISSFALMLFLRDQLTKSIGDAGSPYSHNISLVLLIAGSAAIFFQAALLDFLILKVKNMTVTKSSSRIQNITSEIWSHFLSLGAPIIVLSSYFYFSILLLEDQPDGWATIAEQRPKLIIAASVVTIWYLAHLSLIYLTRSLLIHRLQKQALILSEMKQGPPLDLARLGSLSIVGGSLNRSAEILTERSRLISSFSKYVTDNLIDKIISTDSLDLHGQHIKSAIVMTDLRDFTTLSANMPPNDVVRMLNIYFEDMIVILYQNGIYVDKFIGDGLLAYLPINPQQSDVDVCTAMAKASFEMSKQMNTTNSKLEGEGLPKINLGIGIHFGDVILGSIGSKSRLQYTIIGDSVNRTARLEGLCKELSSTVVISEDFYALLPDSIKLKFTGPHDCQLKGIQGNVKVFNILR